MRDEVKKSKLLVTLSAITRTEILGTYGNKSYTKTIEDAH